MPGGQGPGAACDHAGRLQRFGGHLQGGAYNGRGPKAQQGWRQAWAPTASLLVPGMDAERCCCHSISCLQTCRKPGAGCSQAVANPTLACSTG